MPTKLKNLKVKRVAFVDEGANPDAHIRFAKRRDEAPDIPADVSEEQAQGIVKRISEAILSILRPSKVDKSAATYTQVNAAQKADDLLYKELYPMTSAFTESVRSILADNDITAEERKGLLEKTLSEFSASFGTAAVNWANGLDAGIALAKSVEGMTALRDSLNIAIEKANAQGAGGADPDDLDDPEDEDDDTDEDDDAQGGTNTPAVKKGVPDMKFNTDAMTAEERAQFEELAKRYGSEDNPAEEPVTTPETDEQADVYKGLDPAVKAEIESLRKFREEAEQREMLEVAKRYTLLGKKPEELAKSLKTLKDAGGTAYADMIALLDANLEMVEKSGAFSEIGKRGSAANTDDAWAKIETAAAEIQKSRQGMSWADAIDQACVQHPDLVDEYEKSRR